MMILSQRKMANWGDEMENKHIHNGNKVNGGTELKLPNGVCCVLQINIF